jgi:hypothetical protein
MTPVYNWFGGRCTFFALIFTAGGIALAFRQELGMTYVSLVGAVQALLVAHSWKEDFFSREPKDGKGDA